MPYSWIFISLLVAEILSIVLMASWLGGLATILLMALFFFLGIYMLRHFGMSAVLLSLDVFRNHQGGLSLYQALWPMRYSVAALCFLLPGFFSDLIGLTLLLPLKGKPIINGTPTPGNPDVIDGEFTEIAPEQTTTDTSQPMRRDE